MKGHFRNLFDFPRRCLADTSGGVLVYTAFFLLVIAAAGALALDIGRMAVLRTQMQNRADAGAMAGATQLDGRDGARSRATALAVNSTTGVSAVPADGSSLAVQNVSFYSEIEPSLVAAIDDSDSVFIEVILEPRRLDIFLGSIGTAMKSTTVQTSAVARANPFICHAPPLMICDPAEFDTALDLSLASNVGRQVLLKPPPSGGTQWAPGNYGLLALPDGSIGASDIEDALAAVEPADCYTLDVGTAPGVKTEKVKNGVNARFDLPGTAGEPAPNVINFPRDTEILADPNAFMGSGNWDLDSYWAVKHGSAVPIELTGATRYQVYLYELGESFGRDGRRTAYPLGDSFPEGFNLVTPPGPDVPENSTYPDDPEYDGVPSRAPASNGYARRLVQVAVLACVADEVRGSHSYPTRGRYVEMFITEAVGDTPEGGIFAEVVRPLTVTNDPDFHANVQLVR